MSFDKRVWATLGIVATIVVASFSVFAVFETRDDHKKDIANLEQKQNLELRVFAAEFASEMGQKQAEIMLPSILRAIKKYHPDDHSFLDTDKVKFLADGKIAE